MLRRLIVVVLLLVVGLSSSIQAQVPVKMAYQGRLTDSSSTPLSGTYSLTFSLYTQPLTGTAIWTETQGSVSVSVGAFSVELGSVMPLDPTDFTEPLYLGIAVGGDSEMTPRLPLTSAPYAFKPVSYAKVAIVAKGGGDYTSPVDAMANVSSGDSWCGTPSATNRCLVKIMPGVYDIGSIQIVMQQYVSIRGSGQETTKLTGAVSTGSVFSSAIVVGADDVDLSDLAIENTGTGTNNQGVYNTSFYSPVMTNVAVNASGGINNYGVYNYFSQAIMSNVTATASGGTDSYGVYNAFSSPTMSNVTATASGGTNNHGVYNNSSSSPTMTNIMATASGGMDSFGFILDGSTTTMEQVTGKASEAASNFGFKNKNGGTVDLNGVVAIATATGSEKAYGIHNQGDSAATIRSSHIKASGGALSEGIRNSSTSGNSDTVAVHVLNSVVEAVGGTANSTIRTDGEFAIKIGNSQLSGGTVDTSAGAGGSLTCINTIDEGFAALTGSCL